MSSQIQVQSDIGALGIRGLGAFSTLLATISADDVAPLALIQMESLGSLFHVNGPNAEKVPDMLKRFSSQPIGRLAITVGWRRGDAASLMADSSGGQAIALLSTCLTNLFRLDVAGVILHKICARSLPRAINVASISQLGDVASLLSKKLNALGFGNYLAQQVVRLHAVYHQLQATTPDGLLNPLAEEAVVDLLERLVSVYKVEGAIARIAGFAGMGYVIALVLFLFPNDTVVTVESFVLHEGPGRQFIFLELDQTRKDPIQVRVERVLTIEPIVELPIKPAQFDLMDTCKFAWHGWIARKLQLSFSDYGVCCTQDFLIACCNLLVAVAPEIDILWSDRDSVQPANGGVEAMLGQSPWLRMEHVCEDVLLATPSLPRMNVLKAFSAVALILEDATKSLNCSCRVETCRYVNGWICRPVTAESFVAPKCPRKRLWSKVGTYLGHGLTSFLLNVGPNVSITGSESCEAVKFFIDHTLGNLDHYHNVRPLYHRLFGIFAPYSELVTSSGSTTFFPTILKTLKIPSPMLKTFELVDGQLIFEGRSYLKLQCRHPPRPRTERSILYHAKSFNPSSNGVHSNLRLTITEGISHLEMKASARYGGISVDLDLGGVIQGYYNGLRATEACTHRSSISLNERYTSHVLATSVAAPQPASSKVGFVMTQSNPRAQLLACENNVRMLLLHKCCLNCAFQQAKENKVPIVIVT